MPNKPIIQKSIARVGGTIISIVYIKRPDQPFRMYKLTRSSSNRIATLNHVKVYNYE